jgi:surface polysaccharide O-acyltransferase-like enzyme
MAASSPFPTFRDSERDGYVDPGGADMTDIPIDAKVALADEARSAPRLLFIDNIRWTMIVLVLSMHASDTYSPFGNWYYVDRRPVSFGTELFFGVYQSFLQAFFMALLFFVAGHFSAASFDRKGFARFARDRFMRLGVPTLLYMLVIGPLTQYFLSHTWGKGGFAHQWVVHLKDGEWLSETGPMWFAAALLIFSIIYALVRQTGWRERSFVLRGDLGGGAWVAAFVLVMAASTFLVRIAVPEDAAVLNAHPGDFPQYVLMFAAGAFGYRGRWMTELPEPFCVRLGALLLALSLPLLVVLAAIALQGDTALYNGGLNAASGGRCLWEALVCIGMSLLLVALFRRHFDRQGPAVRLFSDNAFGIYLIHPPVLIGFAILLHPLAWPAIAKALLLTLLAAAGSLAASALILRKSPLRAIV